MLVSLSKPIRMQYLSVIGIFGSFCHWYLCLNQSEHSIFLSLVFSFRCTSIAAPLSAPLFSQITFLTNNNPITVLRPLLLASLQCTLYCNRREVTVFSSSHGCFIGSITTDRNNNPGTTRVVRRLFRRAVFYTLIYYYETVL